MEWRPAALDELLPADHRARVVWRYVEGLDLSPLYAPIKAVVGGPGRDPVDPRILLALWLLATIEGVSRARQLARLCERDLAYMWICGGVGVNYHLLADFRTAQGEFLDRLLTDTLATLLHQELVTLDVVAQDGMRVRAHAGSSSFRRQKTLEEQQALARQRVEQLRQEGQDDSQHEASNARREAAQQRAATEREARVTQALAELPQLQAQKEQNKKGSGEKARCSTTDPEARIMKTGDGGFRPAYNVQFATEGEARLIVAVEVVNSGSDRGQMAPLHQRISKRYGKTPKKYLVDCGFATKDDITALEKCETQVLAPIHGAEGIKRRGNDPHAPKKGDSPEMITFRQRMATEEAQALYKQRPSIAEYPNAECRNRGLAQFAVRGLKKVKAVALWYAVAFNFLRLHSLGLLL